jgi:hypothetical protein
VRLLRIPISLRRRSGKILSSYSAGKGLLPVQTSHKTSNKTSNMRHHKSAQRRAASRPVTRL